MLFRSTEKLGSQGSLHTPFRLDQIGEDDLNKYDAIFIPGGHAPLVVRFKFEDG